jgi:hypothetical protein
MPRLIDRLLFNIPAAARLRGMNISVALTVAPMLAMLTLVLAACARDANTDAQRLPMTIRGVVNGASGPVADAVVQLQGSDVRIYAARPGSGWALGNHRHRLG